MMVLLLTVLVFGAVPAKADEPLPQEGFSKVLPPKIWELKPPEFGEEFLIAEPTGGSANGANIVFANENEGLAALQQEVRVCHQWCEFILQVFCEHFFFSTKTGTESSGKLLLGEFSVRKERIETQEQKPLIVYRNLEVQAGGMGLAAALETNGWAGHPSVAWNPVSENYLVTFWSNTEGLPRIYAWEVSTGGNLGVANMRIGDDGKDVYRQFYPSVAVTADGRYLVVWEQDRYEKPGAFQVFGQWLSPEGQLVGESFQISTGTYEQHPKLVWVAQRNAFLVVYMYPYMDYDGFHVEIRG
ncbi:MAG: hypothetical protein FJ044_04360, partial [Candidatus Cloacimonetes bacterium]|nr:hypothetical protein [Candidatus Cloacimonadota bacterium]